MLFAMIKFVSTNKLYIDWSLCFEKKPHMHIYIFIRDFTVSEQFYLITKNPLYARYFFCDSQRFKICDLKQYFGYYTRNIVYQSNWEKLSKMFLLFFTTINLLCLTYRSNFGTFAVYTVIFAVAMSGQYHHHYQ